MTLPVMSLQKTLFPVVAIFVALSASAANFVPRHHDDLALPSGGMIQAEILAPVKVGFFKLGVGSKMRVQAAGAERDGWFLGRLVRTDLSNTEFLFLDAATKTMFLLDQTRTQLGSQGQSIDWSFAQPILDPLPQVGEDCAGYAIFHYLFQLSLSGFQGNGGLAARLATETARSELLAQSIEDYYMVPQNDFDIGRVLNGHQKDYGFTCAKQTATTSLAASQGVLTQLTQGNPVILDFWIGPDMVTSAYRVQDPDHRFKEDPRLWIPRKIGQSKAGGHVIVAAAHFRTDEGREKLLVVDSDWPEPRIWDVENYLVSRVRPAAVNEFACH